jgi:hypothetical protein
MGWTEDELSAPTKAVLNAVELMAREQERPMFRADYEQLEAWSGVSRRTMFRRLNDAEEAGWIDRDDGILELLAPEASVSEWHQRCQSDTVSVRVTPRVSERHRECQSDTGDSSSPSPPPQGQKKVSTPSKKNPNPSPSSSSETTATAADTREADGSNEPGTDPPEASSTSNDDEPLDDSSPEEPEDGSAGLSEWGQLLAIEQGDQFLMELADFFDRQLAPKAAMGHWSHLRRESGFDVDAERLRAWVAEKVLDLETDAKDYPMRKMLEIARDDVGDVFANEDPTPGDETGGAQHESYIPDEKIPDGTDPRPPPDPNESTRTSNDPLEAFAPDSFLEDMEEIDDR